MKNMRVPIATLMLLGLVACAASAAAAAPIAPPAPPARRPMPRVVVIGQETLTDIYNADKYVERKMFEKAAETYQSLLAQPNLGLAPSEDNRLFVSARLLVNEKIAAMGPEGLAAYRTLYEPQAKALYEKAIASADLGALYRLTREYRSTDHGLKAFLALGSAAFDRGQFLLAGHYWRTVLEGGRAVVPREELLARLAAAYHLGGEKLQARKMADELKAKYPQAKATIGGRERNLVEFVASVLAVPATGAAGAGDDWAGIGAIPGGAGIMADCPATLEPTWTEGNFASLAASAPRSASQSARTQPAERSFLALGECLKYMDGVTLREGHVRGVNPPYTAAATIHLAAVAPCVLCRGDDGVLAMDPATGEVLWRTELPFIRRLKELDDLMVPIVVPARRIVVSTTTRAVVDGNAIEVPAQARVLPERRYVPFFRYGAGTPCDVWQYAPTVGDGKVFVLGGFIPRSLFLNQVVERDPNLAGKLVDDSFLAAVSIADRGAVVWTVGQGQGGDDVLRKGKFLVAPAYRDGRLYAVAQHQGDYYLLCLDARDGALLWKSSVVAGGAMDVLAQGGGEVSYPIRDWAAPPAIVGDRVFLLTTGAVGAYDLRTGEPLWAYEYPIEKRREGARDNGTWRSRPQFNVSALAVASERVVFMPSDSHVVCAVSAANGKLLWQKDREGHQDLTALDANTVLLSGFDPQERARVGDANHVQALKDMERELAKDPQKNKVMLDMIRAQLATTAPAATPKTGTMAILDATSGQVLYRAPDDCLIVGRPAVTEKEVIASGFGKFYRLRLSGRTLTAVDVKDPAAVLGNLLVFRGRLYSANACGITAYGQ